MGRLAAPAGGGRHRRSRGWRRPGRRDGPSRRRSGAVDAVGRRPSRRRRPARAAPTAAERLVERRAPRERQDERREEQARHRSRLGGGGQRERHGGALADGRLDVDPPVVHLHDAVHHGEADARAARLRREVEAEDLVEVLRRRCRRPDRPRGSRPRWARRGGSRSTSVPPSGIAWIALLTRLALAWAMSSASAVTRRQPPPRSRTISTPASRGLGPRQARDVRQHGVDVDRREPEVLRPDEAEEALDDAVQPLDLVRDDVDVLGDLRRHRLTRTGPAARAGARGGSASRSAGS